MLACSSNAINLGGVNSQKFILKERDLNLLFRGSRNQRLIDMPKTLKKGEIVLFDEDEYNELNLFKKTEMYI